MTLRLFMTIPVVLSDPCRVTLSFALTGPHHVSSAFPTCGAAVYLCCDLTSAWPSQFAIDIAAMHGVNASEMLIALPCLTELGCDAESAGLCVAQVKYPENFFLLRGNHECASINRIYGFYDECKRRYNIRLWKTFTDCFNCLPVAALIDEKVCRPSHTVEQFREFDTAMYATTTCQ